MVSEKSPIWYVFIDEGIVIFINDVHFPKALAPIDSTDFGISTFFNDVHLLNALSPIDVTEDGESKII